MSKSESSKSEAADKSSSSAETGDEDVEMVSESYILGIDEAGRGPVLGPMVYGICYCPASKEDELKKMGFADSKVLTAEQRETLFEDIKKSDFLGWLVDVLSPDSISANMFRRPKVSLNAVSHNSAIGLVQKVLDHGVNLTKVFVDTVGPPEKYERMLTDHFSEYRIKFTVAKKADSKFPIVSAASICAKVTRDKVLEDWKFTETGVSLDSKFGSGYPSDPATKAWIQNNCDSVFGFPIFVRTSWSTAQTVEKVKSARVDWGDDDDKKSQSITSLFSKGYVSRNIAYKRRCLSLATDLISDGIDD
eukprot:137739_1